MISRKRRLILALCFFIHNSFLLAQSASYIVEYHTSIKVEKRGLIEEIFVVKHIDSNADEGLSNIEIHYGSGESLDILEAVILNEKGESLRKLKKKEITTKSNISSGTFYEDRLIKKFSLSWNEYPYRIKYRYRKSYSKFISITQWHPMLHTNIPVKKASLQVEIPYSYKVKYYYTPEFTHRIDSLEKSYRAIWEIRDFQPVSPEDFSPPLWELIPSVTIIPETFTYGLQGSFETWASFGNWQAMMNANLDILPQQEAMKVDKMIVGISHPKEIIKTLYQYMQRNTRYVNVAIDVGGLKPYPASYVCTNKYGDCKALTIYMKALLNQAGIPSYYTKVYASENPVKIKESYPSQQFNHVILCVPLEGDTIWLENTADYLPYNYLGTFAQNRYALLVDEQRSQLVKTPSLDLEDVLEKNTYQIQLDLSGNGRAAVLREVRGNEFVQYKYILDKLKKGDQFKAITQEIPLNQAELLTYAFDQPDPDVAYLTLDLSINLKKQFRKLGRSLILRPVSVPVFNLNQPERRKYPVRINYPINKYDSMVYELPFLDEYHIKLPEPVEIESAFGMYSEKYIQKTQQLIIIRNFQLFRGDYPLETYPAFYAFFESIRQASKKTIVIFNPS